MADLRKFIGPVAPTSSESTNAKRAQGPVMPGGAAPRPATTSASPSSPSLAVAASNPSSSLASTSSSSSSAPKPFLPFTPPTAVASSPSTTTPSPTQTAPLSTPATPTATTPQSEIIDRTVGNGNNSGTVVATTVTPSPASITPSTIQVSSSPSTAASSSSSSSTAAPASSTNSSDSDDATRPALVLDIGSLYTKFGLSNESVCHWHPSVVGRDRGKSSAVATHGGSAAWNMRTSLALRYPLKHVYDYSNAINDDGKTSSMSSDEKRDRYGDPVEDHRHINWDDIYYLWRQAYRDMNVTRNEHLVLTQSPISRFCDRQCSAEILFEHFSVASLSFVNTAVCSLISAQGGATTGTAIEIGDGSAWCVPVYEGQPIRHGIVKLPVAGRDLTYELMKRLRVEGTYYDAIKPDDVSDVEHVRTMIQQSCYLPLRLDEELYRLKYNLPKDDPDAQFTYELPDGRKITYSTERVTAPEIIMTDMVASLTKSINQCDRDIRRTLYGNIMLGGGGSQLKGLVPRLLHELSRDMNAPPSSAINVMAHENGATSAWRGAAILASYHHSMSTSASGHGGLSSLSYGNWATFPCIQPGTGGWTSTSRPQWTEYGASLFYRCGMV